MSEQRPDPDALLRAISVTENARSSAKFRIFFGMSAGVGKTYAMLRAAHQQVKEGKTVIVGIVETHGRSETADQLEGLELLPRKKIEYRGTELEELDIDALLARKPDIALIDELAHSNAPGSRHEKRWQDVFEILDAGIDVYATVNVQHLESRKDSVEAITGVRIRETVPDSILERAAQIELIDVAPVELLKRLREGKVYLGEKAETAAQKFFKEDTLTALREIALRLTAERVDQDLQRFSALKNENMPWQTNERLMVAVSHSPFSERLIRATRRLAYNLEAPWIAVYVDTGIALSNADQTQLAKNLELARELKAEVITTLDFDIASALKRMANQKNVTQILVGRPTHKWIRNLLEGGSLLDRLVRESTEVDVHVIRQERFKHTGFTWSQIQWGNRGSLIPYWNVFWFVCAVGGMSAFAEPIVGYRAVGFFFLIAVLIVGLLAAMGPVIFAAVLSTVIWDYFFIPPTLTFRITQPDDFAMCISLLATALITGLLTNRVRRHERVIRERENRTSILFEVLQDIATSREKTEFLSKTTQRLGELLDAECGAFLRSPEGDLQLDVSKPYTPNISEKEKAVASWAYHNGKPAGWSTDTLAQSEALYIPMKTHSETAGVFVIRPRKRRNLSLEQEILAHSIIRQLATSLERHFFEKRLLEARRLEDSERLHQTLLNSISHEMRTPLTSILGGASTLETAEVLTAADVKRVAEVILEAGDRLQRVIENLLDMTRLNSGSLHLHLQWHDLRDLIASTSQRLQKVLKDRKISITYLVDSPVLRLDYRLFEHALSNLLTNAAAYSPEHSEISIVVESDENKNNLLIKINDQGPGIPFGDREKIFEKFYRLPGSPAGGTGLGLSIVKGIVEAHRGQVFVRESPSHGAQFVIKLPIEQPTEEPLQPTISERANGH